MGDIAKVIIVIGFFLIILGAIMLLLGKIPGFGKLPGDIMIKKENFTFYFPLTTCVILSLVLTLISYLWSKR